MNTIHDTHTDNLVIHTCWCGIRHAIPSALSRQAVDNRMEVYCPLGHTWVKKKTRAQELESKLARQRAMHDQTTACLRDKAEAYKNSARAQKAAKTRIKNRVANGVCPCCNRHFKNLHAHMKNQHPDYTKSVD